MTESPSSSNARPPATPRWVKVFGVVAVLVVLLVVVLLLTGGHKPRRHGAVTQGANATALHTLPFER